MFIEVDFLNGRDINPESILEGYSMGIFPMAEDNTNEIHWYTVNPRGIITLNQDKFKFNIPHSLRQVINKNIFEIKIDTNFKDVIEACAARESTWISPKIIDEYYKLYKMGYAHSVEVYYENKLAGGLYGVALKGAFFGESMFYYISNASKVAVVNLYNILKKNSFVLFDIQMITSVFSIFNAIYIPRSAYNTLLENAMKTDCKFQI